jgi:hypothetical protein
MRVCVCARPVREVRVPCLSWLLLHPRAADWPPHARDLPAWLCVCVYVCVCVCVCEGCKEDERKGTGERRKWRGSENKSKGGKHDGRRNGKET